MASRSKRDAQTANEEQARVAGVLDGKVTAPDSVSHLSGAEADSFNWAETLPNGPDLGNRADRVRAQDRLAGKR